CTAVQASHTWRGRSSPGGIANRTGSPQSLQNFMVDLKCLDQSAIMTEIPPLWPRPPCPPRGPGSPRQTARRGQLIRAGDLVTIAPLDAAPSDNPAPTRPPCA